MFKREINTFKLNKLHNERQDFLHIFLKMLTKNVYLDEQFYLTFLFGPGISHWKLSRGFEILEKTVIFFIIFF